jgi:hypothetical protein
LLASEVIDRVFSDIFWPSGIDRPAYDTLSLALNDVDVLVSTSGRQVKIPRDSMLEIDDELLLASDVAGTQITVQERGWLNTTPANHAAGTRVYLDPTYTRLSVFNALKACIGLLYSWGLYWRKVEEGPQWSTAGMLPTAAGVMDVIRVMVQTNTTNEDWRPLSQKGDQWEFFNEWTTPRIRFYRGGSTGAATRIVYAYDFTVPDTTGIDLSDCGISETLQPFLPLVTAGYILQNREVPRVQIDDVRRLLAAQGVQVGASMNIGQSMVNAFRSVYVSAERQRLSRLDPMTFEFVGR